MLELELVGSSHCGSIYHLVPLYLSHYTFGFICLSLREGWASEAPPQL